MSFRFISLFFALIISANLFSVSAQVNPVVGQISSSNFDTYVRDISGDGRFVLMESTGNIATVNPRNSDGNREIFLFDYAQRRIFQITNTKCLLADASQETFQSNIKVNIYNTKPTLSNDGRWIAFSSNATTSTPTAPNATNPGNFIANNYSDSSGNNPLTSDANMEIWLYQIPAVSSVDLTSGVEVPLTDLAAGTFTRVTNTNPSRLPTAGTTLYPPIIADDNRDVTIDDTGATIAFISNRDIVVGGNTFPNDDNPEVYAYKRASSTFGQVTQTPRGNILAPIYNVNPSISGNGLRVTFVGNANNPIVGMTGGANTDNNEEIFYSDLSATAQPTGTKKQITTTTAPQPENTLNFLNYGRRISRNGRYITFDSAADITNVNSGNIFTAIATFVYDTTVTTGSPFRQIGPRGDADSGASEGDVFRFPTFSDYDGTGEPSSLVLATRLNIKADGTVPSTSSDGFNDVTGRPAQIYTYTLNQPAASATFKRISKNPNARFIISSTQPMPANISNRIAFNLAQTELGGGNFDGSLEAYYLFVPTIRVNTLANLSFATGATYIPVSNDEVPTPTPTPTPSPTPTPTVTPSPTPSPTPQQPSAVRGISPGMLAVVNIAANIDTPVTPATVVGSNSQQFPLPLEINGVSATINGAACGLRYVSRTQLIFVVPFGLTTDTSHEMLINMRGVVMKGNVYIVPARPDIFQETLTNGNLNVPIPGTLLGRAYTRNVTNRVFTREPYLVKTNSERAIPCPENTSILCKKVSSMIRIYLTGVYGRSGSEFTVRFSSDTTNTVVGGASATPVAAEIPGMYYMDVRIPAGVRGLGDVPIVVSAFIGVSTYSSRLDSQAPVNFILP